MAKGRLKGRSEKTVENKKMVLTKQYERCPKLQKKMSLQEWLKQIKELTKK